MDNIAVATINTFLPKVEVQPVEEPIFVLTATELRQIITGAVRDATESILSQLNVLEAKITSLEKKNAAIEAQEETDISHLAEGQAQDRRRITALETRPAPPAQAEVKGERTDQRITKLKEFLKARGGGATFQEVERLLGIRPNQMTKLVSQLDKRSFEVFTRARDGRQRVLRLKARICQ